jgi:hypothetical protein
MTIIPQYGRETTTRRFSLAALGSLLLGIVAGPDIVWAYTRIYIVTASVPLQWVIFVQMFVVPVTGLTLGIISVSRRRRMWWLGLFGIVLNALAILFLSASIAKAVLG